MNACGWGLAAETTPGKGIQRLNSHAWIEPVARREEVTVLEATVQKILAQQKALVQAPILFFLLNYAAKGRSAKRRSQSFA